MFEKFVDVHLRNFWKHSFRDYMEITTSNFSMGFFQKFFKFFFAKFLTEFLYGFPRNPCWCSSKESFRGCLFGRFCFTISCRISFKVLTGAPLKQEFLCRFFQRFMWKSRFFSEIPWKLLEYPNNLSRNFPRHFFQKLLNELLLDISTKNPLKIRRRLF